MRALFFSLPMYGHTNPSLPLVRALAARGDEVVYVSTEPFAKKVKASGARYRSYCNAYLDGMTHLPPRMESLGWDLTRTTAELMETQLDAFRGERPDYVIADSLAFWGPWIAAALDVPLITSVTTFAFNRHVLTFGVARGARPKSAPALAQKFRSIFKVLRVLRQLRRRHGINGPGFRRMMFPNAPLNVVYTSREFQPRAETFDNRFQFIGPSMDARPDAGTFPWDRLTHPVAVYVSMGTVFNRDEAFYRACFDAFRDAEFQVILALGANVSPAALGEPPPNFIVQANVPQLEVLRRVRAFVTHGGVNSVSEGLYNSVPVLVVPQVSEQMIVGKRAEQLGAGRVLMSKYLTPERLRAGVETLLRDAAYRDAAVRIGESFRSSGGPARGAEAIITFTRARSGVMSRE
jgi:MGT family glycosyltransferase